jgi:ectoine hydroxylase-related dioxygenase (phytanoyl-CoA dioxygenase family)
MPSTAADIAAAERPVTETQRAAYERDGYLLLDSFLSPGWVTRLQAAATDFVEQSRDTDEPGSHFDREPGHQADNPRLRRLIGPVDLDPTFRELALEGPIARLAVDLLGGPVRFHHSKLNYKWSEGGEEIKWHQDIQFWPHSDFSPLTIGVYLTDVDDEMGPMGVVPGSHRGELFDLTDSDGRWTGALRDADLPRAGLERAHYLTGPAGSVTVHNCCAVHGSMPNNSPRMRPLLLQTYSRADSYPLLGVGTNGRTGRLSGTIVGGPAPRTITVDGRAMVAAPDWSKGGYHTIFDVQQRED